MHIYSSLNVRPALGTLAMKKMLLIPAAIVWIGLPALGAHVMFSSSPVAHQIRPTKAHVQYASTGHGSIGSEREAAVIEATRRYVAAHPEAPLAMREGRELAPLAALNADLKERNARFRVKAVEGLRAQFYDVS